MRDFFLLRLRLQSEESNEINFGNLKRGDEGGKLVVGGGSLKVEKAEIVEKMEESWASGVGSFESRSRRELQRKVRLEPSSS